MPSDARHVAPDAPHRVKHAITLGPVRDIAKQRYVVECSCGWSSRLHWNQARANDEYRCHKEGVPFDAA